MKLKVRGKPYKKGEHPSPETEFEKGHKRTPFGKNHWNYKNGKYKFQGYLMVLRINGKGYIKNHLLVAEEKLGRSLTKEEVVHHIDGLRDDDRPENLWIFPNNKSHGLYEGNLHKTYKKWIQQSYNLE